VLVSKSSAEVCLQKNVNVVDIKGSVDCLGAVLDLLLVLLVLTVAESDVVEDVGFELSNFFAE
jgi:hypothetical protein